jgi:surfactin synthase thioesterase subunit
VADTVDIRGLWIRRFHTAWDGAPTLVCLPHAGGAATAFFPLSRALAPAVDVPAVQYPGRQDRRLEPVVDDIGRLADLIAAELRPWNGRPLALFGHSMGAIVGYEVCRRLERSGGEPIGLFASGRRAPSADVAGTVHLRDDAGLLAALIELSGTESAVLGEAELLQLILPAVRGDYRAVETYRHGPGPELGCPITVLVGDSDPVTSLEQAQAWTGHTTAGFRMDVFPGGHFYLNAETERVAKTIRRDLGAWTAVG